MRFFDRLRNGWRFGITSLEIIKEHKSLLLFPVMSALALIFVTMTFAGGAFAALGLDLDAALAEFSAGREWVLYSVLFVYYLVNYFVIVFFNMGLVHCAKLIFDGKKPTVSDGLHYSSSRLDAILSWALLAATVGVVLQILEDRLGKLGQIIVSIIGIGWSIATFFVVPVIAYEEVGPMEAVKRSGNLMREKWGEAVGANFSFGAFFLIGYMIIIVSGIALIAMQPIMGIVIMVLAALLLHTVIAAAKTVFVAAAYNHMNDRPAGRFDDGALNNLFVDKP